jgi:ATP-dependent protease ClpP protease subunit
MENRKRPRVIDVLNSNIIDYQLINDGEDEKDLITRSHNHIYFYGGVNKKNCLLLNQKIREATNHLLSHKDNIFSQNQYIYLHINSYGGSVFAAFSSIDTIISNPIPIISIIEGGSASAATLISVVCDYRIIMPNSYMLIHQLSSGAWGKYQDLKEDMQNLDELMEKIRNIYQTYTKIRKEDLDEILKHDFWWNSIKCLENNLVDEIYNNKKLYEFNKKQLNLH